MVRVTELLKAVGAERARQAAAAAAWRNDMGLATPGAGLALFGATCLALLLWALVSDTGRITAKWLADPVFHSTSAAAALLLLGSAGGCGCWLAMLRCRAPRFVLDRVRTLTLVLIGALLAAQGAVLAAHVAYARDVGLPLLMHGYHWQGTENTYNFLLHSHVGKALLGGLRELIAFLPGRYDAGEPLSGNVPVVAMWAAGIGLVAGAAAAVALLPVIALRFEQRWSLVWAYGFSALNCLKTIPDGGPLTYRFLPSFLVLCALLLARDVAALREVARKLAWPAAVVLGAYLILWRTIADEEYGAAFGGLVMLMIATLGPAAAAWRPAKSARRRLRTLLLVPVIAVAGVVYVSEALVGAGMLLRPLPAGYRYTVIDATGLRVGDLQPVIAGESPAELYRRLGDDPLKPRRVFLWREGQGQGGALTLGVTFVGARAEAHVLPADAAMRIVAMAPGPDNASALMTVRADDRVTAPHFDLVPSILSNHNYHLHLQLAAALLRTSGSDEFVLLPLLDEATLRRFRGGRGSAPEATR